jgi:hypothetical protein
MNPAQLNAIAQCRLTSVLRTVSAAKHFAIRFHTVSNDAAAAMAALRGERVNGTFKRIKRMVVASHGNDK